MIVKCNETECKHNTIIRLRGGAERARCCTLAVLNLEAEITPPFCACVDYERKVTDGRE